MLLIISYCCQWVLTYPALSQPYYAISQLLAGEKNKKQKTKNKTQKTQFDRNVFNRRINRFE